MKFKVWHQDGSEETAREIESEYSGKLRELLPKTIAYNAGLAAEEFAEAADDGSGENPFELFMRAEDGSLFEATVDVDYVPSYSATVTRKP